MSELLQYWIGFSRVPGIGPVRLRALLDHFGDVRQAWEASSATLRALGFDRRTIESFVVQRSRLDLAAELARVKQQGVTVLTWDSPNYPSLLMSIPDPPPVLYVRGELLPRDDWALAVVGTRRATVYGREATRTLVSGLAASGVTIVSGLARGIDTHAHQIALDVGGRTIAVLGSGVDIIYPAQNYKLAHRIVENGALVSEYPLGTQPEGGNFPRRNRIISGLSLGVLVVEGSKRSGAMITADYAVDQGREIFAVPGSILNSNSAGPNQLIQQGAKLVTTLGDILEDLNLTMVAEQVEARQVIPDNDTEAVLLHYLSSDPMHVDELGRAAGLPIQEVASTLTLMELKGKVRQVGGMHYVIAREAGVPYIVE
ncbi:MAG: DNA-processing protein DprA [Anaerolineae bacterium]